MDRVRARACRETRPAIGTERAGVGKRANGAGIVVFYCVDV